MMSILPSFQRKPAFMHGFDHVIRSQDRSDVTITKYISPIKDKEILIYYNSHKGLVGSVKWINSQGEVVEQKDIPLRGVPEQIFRTDLPILQRFLNGCYFVPKKNRLESYEYIELRESLKGGMKEKIPFQPGLALGSIVKGDVIQKMETYGETLAKIENTQKMTRQLEQDVAILTKKIKSMERKTLPEVDQQMKRLFEAQKKSLEDQIKKMPEQLKGIESLDLPFFSNITTGLETPIDFDRTTVETDSRGFDSLSYNSQYIDMYESEQRIQDKMDQSSSASQASASVSGGFCGIGFKTSASHSWSSAALNRIADIKNQGHASKILLINALVTTRHVRHFKNLKYNRAKLEVILSFMKSSEKTEDLAKYGITKNEAGEKCIYLLTEAVMGGSFSAIITYLKEDTSNREVRDSAHHASSSTNVSASATYTIFKASASHANTRQKSDESYDDHIHNQGNFNVTIEFIAQGAIPQLARDTVVREALKYQEQNLRQYHSSGSEQENQPRYARQAELQNSLYETMNTVQKTKVEKEEIAVHTPNNVLKAYDDFCHEISTDPSCGVPIGFNYTVLTQQTIECLIKEEKA